MRCLENTDIKKYDLWCLCDIKDHRKLCELILKKRYKNAAMFMFDLDTISRENVPNSIYNLLEEFDDTF